MSLYDAHNHLQDEWLQPYFRECRERLTGLGLTLAVVNGTKESDWPKVAELAREYPWIRPSYGLHPWFLAERSEGWEWALNQQLDQGGFMGEIGLDRWKQPFDFADQQRVFRRQLQIATERQLPVTIHCLQAWGALLEILRQEPLPTCGFLLHAYGGPKELVAELVELGAYFSFSGYFLHERKVDRREIFRQLPRERLLVETDAPAMPLPIKLESDPLPLSPEGQRINHPANLRRIYEHLAPLRGVTMEELSESVSKNFVRLFGV